MDEKLYQHYFDALIKGDKATCNEIIMDLLDKDVDIRTIYIDLFQRSLYQVGELWERNKISVATEHLATAITEGLLGLLYPRVFGAEHNGKKAVVSCAVNEYHQIGGKMVADIFEINGWDSHFLGANTPLDSLLEHIQEFQPDVLALSLSMYSNLPKLLKTTDTIRGNYLHLDIVFGGQAFRWGGQDDMLKILRTQYFPSLIDFENSLKP
ncbi:MAG: cobalamin-binding protein [Desulfobulbaceae bacterium]|nr:MAG: cobalamin-binding protein [Desulfobulbaceae bacterium]